MEHCTIYTSFPINRASKTCTLNEQQRLISVSFTTKYLKKGRGVAALRAPLLFCSQLTAPKMDMTHWKIFCRSPAASWGWMSISGRMPLTLW